MLNRWLFKQVDNSALVVFRALFGLLIAIEAFGAIFTGWIRRTLIEPDFTFNFIGFEFLQPLPGNGMLWYYGIMGVFGIFVMLGFKYRLSIVCYGIMWAAVYLMQKSSYNNHYYLLMLLCIIMSFLPANRWFSLDAKIKPEISKISMPRWVWVVIVLQLWIVFTYASVAKLYPDWLDGSFPALLMRSKADYWLVGEILQQGWVRYAITYFGLLFDLLIIPLLFWKRTRLPAFIAAIFFHLFNSFIFHIGIFPYMSLAFSIFFFPTEKINKWFLRNRKKYYDKGEIIIPPYRNLLIAAMSIWFIIQVCLPLRHWFFKDDVLWTEEGHRLSWRMMLRGKSGRITFKVVEKGAIDTVFVNKKDYLSRKQLRAISTKPDMIWQFVQRIEEEYVEKGKEVEIYAEGKISVNGGPYKPLIDPKVDLAAEKWQHFRHHDWILPSDSE
ncbi:HTTM domain-containing protein [Christiangramia forsetii]|uniref:Vitamin K-dependent gamma-carboxylase n=2 Tax=Christiangramia forsetii TaxID=411153 RepID=A0M748_CHRFK|nr:HTTM domain-containing protein [Christiangramia forsetii]GGG28718.1 type I deoxyribonuclease HsdR [Christiangramia forsetii]CAL68443.1 vitamin K-dependent gamma-carboxylase [Christiangramia forsetii KT0803]